MDNESAIYDNIDFLLQEAFLGYKYRKHAGILYEQDALIPTKLIYAYYFIEKVNENNFTKMKSLFITHYINNESELEAVDTKTRHGKQEVLGLKAMYEYIHSKDIDYMFNIYTLKDLHEKLYSYTEFPEAGGEIRNVPVFLPGSGVELSDPYNIRMELNELDKEVERLRNIPKPLENITDLLGYLNDCVVLNCKLIKIHPFYDGNGRTVRGFTNKLLEDAGLPPIYIKKNERAEYCHAMNLALTEDNYMDILGFYRYKICDSIIELDINNRMRKIDGKTRKYVK